MSVIKQFISRIPYWAFLLVLLVNFVNTLYYYYSFQVPESGGTEKHENGQLVCDYVIPGGPLDKAGMKSGDIMLSFNSMPIGEWVSYYRDQRAGDTLIIGFMRNKQEMSTVLVYDSINSYSTIYITILFAFRLLLSIASLFILFKKSRDPAVLLFFIYIQLYVINSNYYFLSFQDILSVVISVAFCFSIWITGLVLIHFHLMFPVPVINYNRFKKLLMILYSAGFLIFIVNSVSYIQGVNSKWVNHSTFFLLKDKSLWWLTATLILAISTAVYQFIINKNTLARKQLILVIIGSIFAFIAPMLFTLFPSTFWPLSEKYPDLINYSYATILIMIACILIAIFRYRIWEIEIIFRKALLYLGATMIITISYFLIIFLVNQLIEGETDLNRFLSLAVSVIIFLVLRDMLQRLINRFFHREAYDSATVVADFEEKLAGIYRFEELKSGIVKGLDDIFHFKSLVFSIKKEELTYVPAYSLGQVQPLIEKEYKVTPEMERRLQKSQVFSPAELDQKPSVPEMANGELVVPLLKENKPYGFFLCGPKKSEKTYSIQDIRVLSLIAKRVIALFNTAGLYQKDLDRQLMLERERARISQDMHDDIGAGLTKIAMISESGFNTPDKEKEVNERMVKVASSSRDMISRLNVIVWALNPRYDNLDSLISYSRRYFGEYLDSFGIHFIVKVPDIIPQLSITPDFRRNVFYTLQEAIHNAVKHGAPSEIKLQTLINGNKIEINVTDNGKGFETDSGNNHGNGLLNMKKRADDICGSFDIQSLPGHGTIVRLVFNLNENTTKG